MTTAKRGGLGRGLAALIPTAPPPSPVEPPRPAPARVEESAAPERTAPLAAVPSEPAPADSVEAGAHATPPAQPPAEGAVGVPGAQLREVSVDDVVPNPKQPRQVFDDEALDELTHS
ncbi:MAG: parB, partial [Frankiales bacterium]|nr:parB [Frankiales bacterium]